MAETPDSVDSRAHTTENRGVVTQEAEAERLGPELEPVAHSTELELFQADLRDCWEGCIPFAEAVEMIGAPNRYRKQLRSDYRRWTRKFEGGR